MFTFQKLIFALDKYWKKLGCNIIQPFSSEIGAATLHPVTFFGSLIDKPIFYSYTQLCKRPQDSSNNLLFNNIYSLQEYYQYQVIMQPSLDNIHNLYLNSLEYIGIDLDKCELKFIEDDWENPTIGAFGVGWEVWLNGMEITQFTYFQKMAGLNCKYCVNEITYGLERIALYLQKVNSILDIKWNKNKFGILLYKDIIISSEKEKSIYNKDVSNIKFLFTCLENYEFESLRLLDLDNPLFIQSYEFAVKVVHYFNLIDTKNYFSEFEKKKIILRIRCLFQKIAICFLKKKE